MNQKKEDKMYFMRLTCWIGLLFIIGVTSCQDEIINESSRKDDKQTFEEESFGPSIVLGKKLNNPYSLENMQAAYDSLSNKSGSTLKSGRQLQPTHYYVRFLPKDSSDVRQLERDSLDLFCYPLDYEIEEWGDYYHDPTIPKGQMTWQYTKVPIDYKFPNVQYEIIEECYIPEEECDGASLRSQTVINSDLLETLSFEMTGNSNLLEKSELRSKEYPSGDIKVYNDITQSWDPVAGVRIRTTNLLRWSNTYTDANGHYQMSSHYRTKVHYAMIFENSQGFKIGNWSVISPARTHEMGFHSNKGYSVSFGKGSDMWGHCTVNNAAYYMYQNYKRYIPDGMHLWVLQNGERGCAAMLGHGAGTAEKALVLMGATAVVTGVQLREELAPAIAILSPDIIVGTKASSSYDITKTTCHELAHSMHFNNVGKSYWNKYILGIIQCYARTGETYGNNKPSDSDYNGHIGVGETWGFAMGYYMANKKMGENRFTTETYWFKPEETFLLLNEKKVTPLQFLDCMDNQTTSLKVLNEHISTKNSKISKNLYE